MPHDSLFLRVFTYIAGCREGWFSQDLPAGSLLGRREAEWMAERQSSRKAARTHCSDARPAGCRPCMQRTARLPDWLYLWVVCPTASSMCCQTLFFKEGDHRKG